MSKQVHVPTVAIAAATILCLLLPCAPDDAHAAADPALTSARADDLAAACRVPSRGTDLVLAHAANATPLYGYNQGVDMREDTGYNTDYLFAMTKSVASSPITPAMKPLLFLITIPLDLVTLPFTAIAGFF